MKFLRGSTRLGVLTSRGFFVENGKAYLRKDEIKQFKLYGIVVGMCFFGFQKAKLVEN